MPTRSSDSDSDAPPIISSPSTDSVPFDERRAATASASALASVSAETSPEVDATVPGKDKKGEGKQPAAAGRDAPPRTPTPTRRSSQMLMQTNPTTPHQKRGEDENGDTAPSPATPGTATPVHASGDHRIAQKNADGGVAGTVTSIRTPGSRSSLAKKSLHDVNGEDRRISAAAAADLTATRRSSETLMYATPPPRHEGGEEDDENSPPPATPGTMTSFRGGDDRRIFRKNTEGAAGTATPFQTSGSRLSSKRSSRMREEDQRISAAAAGHDQRITLKCQGGASPIRATSLRFADRPSPVKEGQRQAGTAEDIDERIARKRLEADSMANMFGTSTRRGGGGERGGRGDESSTPSSLRSLRMPSEDSGLRFADRPSPVKGQASTAEDIDERIARKRLEADSMTNMFGTSTRRGERGGRVGESSAPLSLHSLRMPSEDSGHGPSKGTSPAGDRSSTLTPEDRWRMKLEQGSVSASMPSTSEERWRENAKHSFVSLEGGASTSTRTSEERWREKVARGSIALEGRVLTSVAEQSDLRREKMERNSVFQGPGTPSVHVSVRNMTPKDRWSSKVMENSYSADPASPNYGGNVDGELSAEKDGNIIHAGVDQEAGKKLRVRVGQEVGQKIHAEVGEEVGTEIRAEVGEEVGMAIRAEVGEEVIPLTPEDYITLSPTETATSREDYSVAVPPSAENGGTFQAELAPDEERGELVEELNVKVVKPGDEDDEGEPRFSRKDKMRLGCIVVLAAVGLGVGLGLGLSRSRGNDSADSSSVCSSQLPWKLVGSELTNPVVVADHKLAELTQTFDYYRAFGSDVSLSDSGTRLAINDRYGDNVTIHEFDETLGAWTQLGPGVSATQGSIIQFESQEHYEGESAAVLSGDGNRVAISFVFYNANDTLTRNGQITVHEYMNGSWMQVGNDITGTYSGAYLGRAQTIDLSRDGSIMAIGDYRYEAETGRVQVYQLVDDVWIQLGHDIVGRSRNDQFGRSVSLSANGTVVSISAHRADGTSRDTGYAAVFRFSEGNWTQVGNDLEAELGNCYFGWPVSLSADGNRIAIGGDGYRQEVYDGAPCSPDFVRGRTRVGPAGEVRVYENEGGNWTQISPGFEGYEIGDSYGYSISLSGDGTTLAIGAYFSDIGGRNRGYSRVFRNECGNWTQVGSDFNGTGKSDEHGRGMSLSYNGEMYAVGAPNDFGVPTPGLSSGFVSVYGRPCSVDDSVC